MKLIAGLGNPGDKYALTRHNIGFMATERLAARWSIALKRKGFQAQYGQGVVHGVQSTLLLPQTFMNLSGTSVKAACQALGVGVADLVVVHDEIDLPFGALRVKVGGGHGGHNGLRSLHQNLGDNGYVRLRLGVGRPPTGGDVAGYVLNPFAAVERKNLDLVLETAADVLETILRDGPERAMNDYNNRDLTLTT